MVQEKFGEHNNMVKMLTWPHNSPKILVKNLWDELGKQVRIMEALP